MRQSYKTSLILDDSGRAYAAFAKADYCSEHERGIAGIHALMGCGSEEVDGIARYSLVPEHYEEGRTFVLEEARFNTRSEKGRKKMVSRRVLHASPPYSSSEAPWLRQSEDPFEAWFSERNFRLVAMTEEAGGFLASLAERARFGDVAVFMGKAGNNPFDNGGLVISIPSITPSEQLEKLHSAHTETRRLAKAAEETGIRARLEDANKSSGSRRYHLYALSPRWADSIVIENAAPSAHPVVFFINDGRGIHGWYTVEELDEWIEGKGRVLSDEEAYAAQRAGPR